jgi:putative ABC transport system permease protein
MPSDKEDDVAREIRAHLELEAEEQIADGTSAEEARYAAHRAFGNVTRIREDAATVWGSHWAEHARQDLRYALRTFAKTPGFTILAVLTLALGIGANAAIFTVVNAVLLRPLPFPDSDRVVRIFENVPPEGGGGPRRRVLGLTSSELAAFASQTNTMSHVGAYIPTIRTLTGRGEPVRLIGARLSPSLMSLAGAPLLGRAFAAHEDAPGADPVVILSHASWQQYFGGDPNIIGQQVTLDGTAHRVIGVMHPGFALLDPQDQFWMPMPTSGATARQRLPVTARLKDGVLPGAAQAEVSALVPRLRVDKSGAPPVSSRFDVVRLVDLVVAPVRTPLLMLAGAVGLVLLIACANVGNLLLARGSSRRREIAVRVALGAGRGRLIRQAITESTLLAIVGGVAGLGLALGGVALLRTLATSLPRRDLGPGVGLPRLGEIAVDPSVLTLTLAASVITGIVFGLIPTIRLSHVQITDALHQGASEQSGFNLLGRQRMQGVLIVAEIAMATTLCVGAGLLIQSLVRLSRVNPGYDPSHVLTLQVSLPPNRPDAASRAAAEEITERIRRLPGIRAVGYAESLPMTRVSRRTVALRVTPEETTAQKPAVGTITPDHPDAQFVSQGFLTAMGIPVVAGRMFDSSDRAGNVPVMIVNRALAKSGLLGADPIGAQIYALGSQPWTIVGIVEDIRQSSLSESPTAQIFIDYRQVPKEEAIAGIGLYFSIRTAGDPADLASGIRALVSQVDPQTMVENIAPMEAVVSNSLSRPRLYAVLLGIFAGVAIVLATIGIYGVMAYAVTQRTREIGIRVALGAGRARIMGLVLRQSAAVTVVGIVSGLGGAAALTKSLDQLLFGLTAQDPATFIGVALFFASVSMMAAFVPARRATRVDPLTALRLD